MNLLPEQVNHFNENGYLIFDTQIPDSTLDAIANRLAPYWGHDGKKFQGVPYADFNRIQDGYFDLQPGTVDWASGAMLQIYDATMTDAPAYTGAESIGAPPRNTNAEK